MSKGEKNVYDELEGQSLQLSEKDIEIIVESLMNPPDPSEKLSNAVKKYLEGEYDKKID